MTVYKSQRHVKSQWQVSSFPTNAHTVYDSSISLRANQCSQALPSPPKLLLISTNAPPYPATLCLWFLPASSASFFLHRYSCGPRCTDHFCSTIAVLVVPGEAVPLQGDRPRWSYPCWLSAGTWAGPCIDAFRSQVFGIPANLLNASVFLQICLSLKGCLLISLLAYINSPGNSVAKYIYYPSQCFPHGKRNH